MRFGDQDQHPADLLLPFRRPALSVLCSSRFGDQLPADLLLSIRRPDLDVLCSRRSRKMTPSSSSRRSRSSQHRGTPSSSSATRSSVTMGSATDKNDSSGTRPQTYVKKPVCFCGIEAVQKTAYTPNNYGK